MIDESDLGTATRPLCFVMVPYRAVGEGGRGAVDFPAVYDCIIAPAIVAAGMTPLRADEDPQSMGVFQKAMFERLVLCEFAVADLTHGNPNVYYELGIRHALRPYSTVLMFQKDWTLPLDVAHDSAITYSVNAAGEPTEIEQTVEKLAKRLRGARAAATDSPVYQLVSGLPTPVVDHERIDSFRDRADRDEALRCRLDDASGEGVEAVRQLERSLGELQDLDLRTVLSLLLCYRGLAAFEDLVRLVEGIASPLASVELIQQQYAWALNRAGRDRQAERVAKRLIASRASSETYGLLGRIQKDRARRAESARQRQGLMRAAVDAYTRGFEADWRDPYPGVNALSLMAVSTPADQRFEKLLPVVEFANERRLRDQNRQADYWDHATDLMLAVLQRDHARANVALEGALSVEHDPWQSETTAESLVELTRSMGCGRRRRLDRRARG